MSSRLRPGVSKDGLTQTFNKPLSFRQTNTSLTDTKKLILITRLHLRKTNSFYAVAMTRETDG